MSETIKHVEVTLPEPTYSLLEEAAEISGITIESFACKAVTETTLTTLLRFKAAGIETIEISKEDAVKILEAMNQPFEPNAALQEAMDIAEAIESNSSSVKGR